MAEFEPIHSQEEFDERLKGRLARERERWDKEAGTNELAAKLEAKEHELEGERARHQLEWGLSRRGVAEGRMERIKRLVDLDSGVDVDTQLDALASDVPELFVVPMGAGSGGSSRPLVPKDEALTREQIEGLSPEEMAKPSVMAKIDAFMKGER